MILKIWFFLKTVHSWRYLLHKWEHWVFRLPSLDPCTAGRENSGQNTSGPDHGVAPEKIDGMDMSVENTKPRWFFHSVLCALWDLNRTKKKILHKKAQKRTTDSVSLRNWQQLHCTRAGPPAQMMNISSYRFIPKKITCTFFEDLCRPWWKYKSLNDISNLRNIIAVFSKDSL